VGQPLPTFSRFGSGSRELYARLGAPPGALHTGFNQFAAFDPDARDNRAFVANRKLMMPVPAIGGVKSFGSIMAVVMRGAATDSLELVIPNSGHCLMEQQPIAAVTAVRALLDQQH